MLVFDSVYKYVDAFISHRIQMAAMLLTTVVIGPVSSASAFIIEQITKTPPNVVDSFVKIVHPRIVVKRKA